MIELERKGDSKKRGKSDTPMYSKFLDFVIGVYVCAPRGGDVL